MSIALRVELKKLRHQKLWIVVAALTMLQVLWMLWTTSDMDANDLNSGWKICLYQYPLLNTLMMPTVVAIIASRLCALEHKGETLKLLNTVMPAKKLFDAKLIVGIGFIIVAVLLQIITIISLGFSRGFTNALPVGRLMAYFVFTVCVSITLLLLQQILSLLWINQTFPFLVGLAGSLAGIYILFFPMSINRLILWGYYGVLILAGIDWNEADRIVTYHYTPINWSGFITILGVFILLYFIGRMLFTKKEI